MVQDWEIKPRSEACRECKTAFEDLQQCESVLSFGTEGYMRNDYCDTCWAAKGKEISAFSAWRGIFRKPQPPAEEPLKKETAEELLRRMMENEDPSKRNVIYILAVMLERKRILVERDVRTRDDGVMIRVYEHRKTGETFLVPDPKLGFDQLGQVQQEVMVLLGAKIPAESAKPATTEEQMPEDSEDREDEDETEREPELDEEEDEEDEFDDDDEDEEDDEEEDKE
jgi:hypothetical protein